MTQLLQKRYADIYFILIIFSLLNLLSLPTLLVFSLLNLFFILDPAAAYYSQMGYPAQPPGPKTLPLGLYVFNLPLACNDEILHQLFAPYGQVFYRLKIL